MTGARQIVVRLHSQRGPLDAEAVARRMPGGSLDHGGVRFTTNPDEDCDVVVVVNYLKYDSTIFAREGYVWNWHNEPIVRQPFARGFDRIYTHISDSGDPRVHLAPPILDWWVGKSFDELAAMAVPEKSRNISAIASTKVDIPGHRRRNDFIRRLEDSHLPIDIFGHGRERELADKWEGLAPYRYSITVENTSKDHYWTEKIADCFLSYTVPVYFGATDIGEYFPDNSYVWLPLDNPEASVEVVRELLEDDDWEARLSAVTEARELILRKYSLYGQLTRRVESERPTIETADVVQRIVHGRRTRPGGWIRGLGLSGNIRARLERRRARRSGRRPQ